MSILSLQLAKVDSVRDISNGLQTAFGNLSLLGIQRASSKSPVSCFNAHRVWRLFMHPYLALLKRLEQSLGRRCKYGHNLKRKVNLMDSTLVSLCLSLFDWARYRTRKGAIKVHTVLDYDTGLPCFAEVSDGRKSDLKMAKTLEFPAGSVVVMDRAYVDFKWLYYLDSKGIYFVTRMKEGIKAQVVESYDTSRGPQDLQADEDIMLYGKSSGKTYPKRLRLITWVDSKTGQKLVFLTNQMNWTAKTIAGLYKARWDIEMFFKQVIQALRIDFCIGASISTMPIQIWTASIAILLLEYPFKPARHNWNTSKMVFIIRIHFFNKVELMEFPDRPFLRSKTRLRHCIVLKGRSQLERFCFEYGNHLDIR